MATCWPSTPRRCTATGRAPSRPRRSCAGSSTRPARALRQRDLAADADRAPWERIDTVSVRGKGAAHGVGVVPGVEHVVHHDGDADLLVLVRKLEVERVPRRDARAERVRLVVVHDLARDRGPGAGEPRAVAKVPRST